jgi:hypothetical protein
VLVEDWQRGQAAALMGKRLQNGNIRVSGIWNLEAVRKTPSVSSGARSKRSKRANRK